LGLFLAPKQPKELSKECGWRLFLSLELYTFSNFSFVEKSHEAPRAAHLRLASSPLASWASEQPSEQPKEQPKEQPEEQPKEQSSGRACLPFGPLADINHTHCGEELPESSAAPPRTVRSCKSY